MISLKLLGALGTIVREVEAAWADHELTVDELLKIVLDVVARLGIGTLPIIHGHQVVPPS